MKKYTYIDLFAGAGGLSLGFDNAGFKNLFSVEFDKTYANTYMKNFSDHNMIVDDIKNIDDKKIKSLVGKNRVDIIIGGPPCQGFSIAGNIGRNFIDDDRNKLYREYFRILEEVNPKFFVIENLLGL